MIKEKLSGILDKIEDNADALGGLFGIMSDPMADGRGISAATLEFIMSRISGWTFVDPMTVFHHMMLSPEAYPVFNNVTAAVGGWALGEFGSIIDPKVAKLGRIIKKGATAAAIGNVIGAFIWLPAWIKQGGAGGGSNVNLGGSTSIGQYSV